MISAPSAASVKVTGTVIVRFSPVRPKTGCDLTWIWTYRSPAGPPFSPGAPLPLSLMRWPSPTPAGMRAWIVRVLLPRPLPSHTGHGSSTSRPRPLQSRHGSEKAKLPRLRLAAPVPSQVGQTRGVVPALAPVPLHAVHAEELVSRSETVAPSTASPNESVTSDSMSWPRRALVLVVPPVRPAEPRLNRPPKMSPMRSPAPPCCWLVPPNRSPRSKGNPPPREAPPAPA